MGVSARRPEQHGRPRRRRRLVPLAGPGALRDAGGPAVRAGGRDRLRRRRRRAVPHPEALRRGLPRGAARRRHRVRSRRGRRDELLEPPLEPRRRPLRQPRGADDDRPGRASGLAPARHALPGLRDRREERHAGHDLPPRPRPLRQGRPRRPPGARAAHRLRRAAGRLRRRPPRPGGDPRRAPARDHAPALHRRRVEPVAERGRRRRPALLDGGPAPDRRPLRRRARRGRGEHARPILRPMRQPFRGMGPVS